MATIVEALFAIVGIILVLVGHAQHNTPLFVTGIILAAIGGVWFFCGDGDFHL